MKSGDVVSLKSGGPPMTVIKESGEDRGFFRCMYFPYVNGNFGQIEYALVNPDMVNVSGPLPPRAILLGTGVLDR